MVYLVILMLDIFGLTTFDIGFLGWVLGALYSLILPFYLKIRSGQLTWSDFNYGFIVNFITTIVIGLGVSIALFATWSFPAGGDLVLFATAFFMAAGIDDTLLKEILKVLGVYRKIAKRRTQT